MPTPSDAGSTLYTVELRDILIERTRTPIGVDVAPRISWTLGSEQGEIRPTGTIVTIRDSDQVVWRGSPSSLLLNEVECPLELLASDTRYEVEIDCDTTAGRARANTWFRTGMLRPDDWAPSVWIGAPAALAGPAPVFRAVFDVPAGAGEVRMTIAAGGVVRTRINGHDAAPEVLAVGITGFDKRVQYAVWDITDLVQTGSNLLALELGRGFYANAEPNVWGWERSPWTGEPCVRFLIRADQPGGTPVLLASRPGMPVTTGPTRYDDIYGGETFDARLQPGIAAPEFTPSAWSAAVEVTGPSGALVHRRQPPIRVTRTIHPRIIRSGDGRWLLDAGRVVAGWARIRVRGGQGDRIQVRYGERLTAEGRPDNRDTRGHYNGRFQVDEFVLRGTGEIEEWEPRFGWRGFRYLEVSGWPAPELITGDVAAQVVHNDLAPAGGFATADPTLAGIHGLVVPTLLNNLHSIPTDTPMYEKNGWTADGMLGTQMLLLNLEAHELLAKWVDDIADARDPDGVPRVLAPHGGWDWDWSPAPPWHAAYVLIPWWLYQHSADGRILTRHVDGILRYLKVELARSAHGIATTTLGDWVSPQTPPEGGNPPEDPRVAATAYLAHMLMVASKICAVLGRRSDADRLARQAASVKRAFQAAFLDPERAVVRGDGDAGFRQSHNVLALAFGLVPAVLTGSVADAIARDVAERGNHLNTGALSTKYLLPVLTDHGHAPLALALARQRTFPSWGYWLDHGATTLWEHWHHDSRSLNHFFLGTFDEWLYHAVAGLAPGGPGWSTVRFEPRLMEHLAQASAWVQTRYGRTSIDWQSSDGIAQIDIEVPIGARGELTLPPGAALAHDPESRSTTSRTAIMTGSGRHRFTVRLPDTTREGR